MPTYTLNLRQHYHPWGIPQIPEVIGSLRAKFPAEAGLTVIPGRNSDLGTYRIYLPVAPAGDVFLPLKVMGQEHDFPLEPTATQSTYAGVSNRQLSRGTLYTLYDCTQGPWDAISNDVFDKCVQTLGTLTKQTEHQKFRGSSVFNGNRYFCMIPKGDVPDSVTIPDPTNANLTHKVKIGYKGKGYFCPRCQVKHIGQCPA